MFLKQLKEFFFISGSDDLKETLHCFIRWFSVQIPAHIMAHVIRLDLIRIAVMIHSLHHPLAILAISSEINAMPAFLTFSLGVHTCMISCASDALISY